MGVDVRLGNAPVAGSRAEKITVTDGDDGPPKIKYNDVHGNDVEVACGKLAD
jgi:hypothetical protein